HTCVRLDGNRIKCWGYNNYGQLGLGDTVSRGDGPGEMGVNLQHIELGGNHTAKSIAAGESHTCALLDNNKIKCWGWNDYGQLGQGDTTSRGDGPGEMGDNLNPINLGENLTATSIVAGEYHTCALFDNNTIKCWGLNDFGQLGLGDTTFRGDGNGKMGDKLNPINLGKNLTATSIVAGGYHTCALFDNNTIKCWGWNDYGQLGQGDTHIIGGNPDESVAKRDVIVLGGSHTAKSIAAGESHTCALLDNNKIKCWGQNNKGQLGKGNTENIGDKHEQMGDYLQPIDLDDANTAKSIVAGFHHTCALFDNNTIKCWGLNDAGQLGQGNTKNIGDGADEMGEHLLRIDLGKL
ncbi:MAG TPA: hypothetical protein EYO58_10260, partial [Flavobacteriales bacterium]|nr:hypothetical protein [Flavobacteriales bacterium]